MSLERCEHHERSYDTDFTNCPECEDIAMLTETIQLTFEATYGGHPCAEVDIEVDAVGEFDEGQLIDWHISEIRCHSIGSQQSPPPPTIINTTWPWYEQTRQFLRTEPAMFEIEAALEVASSEYVRGYA